MKVLAIETADATKSIALAKDGVLLDEESFAGDLNVQFWPRVSGLLKKNKVKISDIDVFAANSGPGSWTGLRFGLAVVKGWAVATGKKIFVMPAAELKLNLLAGHTAAAVLAGRCDRGEEPDKIKVLYGRLPEFKKYRL